MGLYLFEHAYTPNGWLSNVLIESDMTGQIIDINTLESCSHPSAQIHLGYAIPSFTNSHSHAFQYNMIGLSEHLGAGGGLDDFWSWRERMYRLANEIEPDSLYTIAQNLYQRMLKRGYGRVVEFHYVHHQPNGKPYSQLAAMGEALMAAAEDVGIDLCLVPILYQRAGFFKDHALEKQKRFVSHTLDDYWNLFEYTRYAAQRYDHCSVGAGVHSMRAVQPDILKQFFKDAPKWLPLHMHI